MVTMQRDQQQLRLAGIQIRQLRERQDMTQTELADAIGKSQSFVSRLELAPSIDVPLPVLTRLARVLRVPLITLLEGVDPARGPMSSELADAIAMLSAVKLPIDRQRLIAEVIRTMIRESAAG